MAFVDGDGARAEGVARPTLTDAQAVALRDAFAAKLIAAGYPYRVVGKVLRVSTSAVHQRLKRMPEATRRDLERVDLGRML
jgi:predicted transcriptional regulator